MFLVIACGFLRETYVRVLLAVFVGFPLVHASFAAEKKKANAICDGIYWGSEDAPFQLSKNEKGFICGFAGTPGWSEIPKAQAKFHLRAFLQKRGYLQPQFEIKNDTLTVFPGEPSRTEEVHFEGLPPQFFDEFRPRRLEDEILNPEFLDQWTQVTRSRLLKIGYPCPEVSAQADPKREEVWIRAQPGQRMKIVSVERPETKLRKDIWQRYDAFKINQYYDDEQLTLTATRLQREGLLESAYFETQCSPDGARVSQKAYLGPSQFLAIGVGATTEEYPILRARWKHSRLDDRASSLMAFSRLSSRTQEVSLNSNIYFWVQQPWWSFAPGVSFEREQERSYETVMLRWLFHFSYERDDLSSRWLLKFGPTQNFQWNVVGPAAEYLTYMSIEGNISRVSHEFEQHFADPFKGYEWSLKTKSQRENLFSKVTADMLELKGTFLWNIKNWYPPLWVLGLRYSLHGTFGEDDSSQTSELGPDFRSYLGGDEDLRGFSRDEISGFGDGYFTTAYMGSELRYANVLPWNLDPFLLADIAFKGYAVATLDSGYLWSPGFGLRWASPIGVFRATFARGIVRDDELSTNGVRSHDQIFLSYGVEF